MLVRLRFIGKLDETYENVFDVRPTEMIEFYDSEEVSVENGDAEDVFSYVV